MVHLEKGPCPSSLASENADAKRESMARMIRQGKVPQFRDFDNATYGAPDVRNQLGNDQCHKCAYCESSLGNQDGGEVEHFRPKTAYRQDRTRGAEHKPAYHWLAYEWDNLMVACHACNRRKGTFFPLTDPKQRDIPNENISREDPLLINPYHEDPAQHLEYRGYLLAPLCNADGAEDPKGRTTIDQLELNRPDLLELRRWEWSRFCRDREDLNLSHDQCFNRMEQIRVAEGSAPEDIEFLGMYVHQALRDL